MVQGELDYGVLASLTGLVFFRFSMGPRDPTSCKFTGNQTKMLRLLYHTISDPMNADESKEEQARIALVTAFEKAMAVLDPGLPSITVEEISRGLHSELISGMYASDQSSEPKTKRVGLIQFEQALLPTFTQSRDWTPSVLVMAL